MDRLSGLDASFLYLETPAQLMHVCALSWSTRRRCPSPTASSGCATRSTARCATCRRSRASCAPCRSGSTTRSGSATRLRHRAPRAPPRAARARRLPRARLAHRPPGRAPARPLASAVGDVGDRGLPGRPGRGLHQDAPRHGRRCLRLEPGLAPVLARPPRRPARPRWTAPATAATSARVSCWAGRCVSTARAPVHAARIIAPTAEERGPHDRSRPQRHGDGRTAHGAAHVVQRHHHLAPQHRAHRPRPRRHPCGQEPRPAPPSTTWCSRSRAARCAATSTSAGSSPTPRWWPACR